MKEEQLKERLENLLEEYYTFRDDGNDRVFFDNGVMEIAKQYASEQNERLEKEIETLQGNIQFNAKANLTLTSENEGLKKEIEKLKQEASFDKYTIECYQQEVKQYVDQEDKDIDNFAAFADTLVKNKQEDEGNIEHT